MKTYATSWQCPSNLALVKYWGKKDFQLPCNPSVSFVLDACHTITTLKAFPRLENEMPGVEVWFQGVPNQKFGERIHTFLSGLIPVFPWIKHYSLRAETENSFPHGAGIASSASGFGALALCLVELDDLIQGKATDTLTFYNKASAVARMGSGSASRSVYGGYSLWGHSELFPGSSDEYAVEVKDIHPLFRELSDSILIVSDEEKSVSSSRGHQAMYNHPYAEARYQDASRNISLLLRALREGDWDTFSGITEREGLNLHGLMMSSQEPFVLLQPSSLSWIQKIQRFRYDTKLPLTYTFDAGPNLHLIYPSVHSHAVKGFLQSQSREPHSQVKCIHDKIGTGPRKINEL